MKKCLEKIFVWSVFLSHNFLGLVIFLLFIGIAVLAFIEKEDTWFLADVMEKARGQGFGLWKAICFSIAISGKSVILRLAGLTVIILFSLFWPMIVLQSSYGNYLVKKDKLRVKIVNFLRKYPVYKGEMKLLLDRLKVSGDNLQEIIRIEESFERAQNKEWKKIRIPEIKNRISCLQKELKELEEG